MRPQNTPTERKPSEYLLRLLLLLVLVEAALLLLRAAKADAAECEWRGTQDFTMAVDQTAYLWKHRNPQTYTHQRAYELVDEHFRSGMRGYLWWSRVYIDSGSDWNPSMVSGDAIRGERARGLCDILFSTFVGDGSARQECADWRWSWRICHEVRPSVRLHLIESSGYWFGSGGDGWSTLRHVFLPGRPYSARCDVERARWGMIGAQHDRLIDAWAKTLRPTHATDER